MATGFHGGGGAHRETVPGNTEDSKSPVHAAKDHTVTKLTSTEGLCGALAAGVLIIGYLFGRTSPEDDITCASELSYELHRRFQETFGTMYCSVLKPFQMKTSADPSRDQPGNCGKTYSTGAELTVEVILSAREICPRCPDTNFLVP